MERRRGVVCFVGVAITFLSGCDTAPDPNFENQAREQTRQRAAQIGQRGHDKYISLMNYPRQSRYAQAAPAQRPILLSQELVSYRGTLTISLKQLEREPLVQALAELSDGCNPLYRQALALPWEAAAPEQIAASKALFETLTACRDRADAADEGAKEVKERARLLRRFASSSMLFVAVAIVAQGDETTGARLWRQAEKLVSDDKPGFQFTPSMLLTR